MYAATTMRYHDREAYCTTVRGERDRKLASHLPVGEGNDRC